MPRSSRGTTIRASLALAALLATAVLGGCGSDQDPADPETVTVALPDVTVAGEDAGAASDGEAATTVTDADPATDAAALEPNEVEAAPSAEPPAPKPTLTLDVPAEAYPVIWVRVDHRVALRTEPGGGELVKRIGRRTEFGSPSVFGVVDQRGNWAGVTTTLLPNGRVGWIKLDPKRIEAGWTSYSIVVDVSDRRAALLEGGESRLSFPVTVGAPGSDTPTGRFAVTDTFTRLHSAAYGCCAVALSATQPNLPSGWLGGNTIAIHGTAGPLGVAASHGCVRAADADVAKLVRRIPLGTPVFVRA